MHGQQNVKIRLDVFCGVIQLLQTDPVIEYDFEMEH